MNPEVESKSKFHRQRTSEQPGFERTPRENRSSGSGIPQSSSPDTPDVIDARILRQSYSNSSQQSVKRRQVRSAAITSLVPTPSQDLNAANASASPSLERVPCEDIITDVPYPEPPSSRISRRGSSKKANVMSTQDSVKMQGQDTLEVRNVTMPNGQSASLVLEDGKLQRIVSSSGSVVEVYWPGSKQQSKQRKGAPDRQMGIKLRTATYPSQEVQEAHALQRSKQGVVKRLTNSLQSQRLSQASLSHLYSVPTAGPFTKSERDVRSVNSLDLSVRPHKNPKRRQTGSSGPSRTASHNDMSTILETNADQRNTGWNPMSSSWLPPNMTSKQEADRADALRREHLKTTGAAPVIGTLLTHPDESSFVTPQHASLRTGPAASSPSQDTASSKASKQGLPSEKKKIWKTIKKFLRIPSKSSKSPKKADSRKGQHSVSPINRAHSFGQPRRSASAERDREMRMRSSSPAAPSAATSGIPFTASPSSQAPSEDAVSNNSQNRMSRSSASAISLQTGTPEEKLSAYNAPSTASTPSMPVYNDLTSRQFKFGPASESPKPPLASGSSQQMGLPRRRSLQPSLDQNLARGSLEERDSSLITRSRATTPRDFAPKLDSVPKQRTSLAGQWQRNFTEGTSGAKVDELLNVSSLQRLAREKTMEMQIVETDDTFELRWHIPLNGSSSKISKVDKYLKNGEVVECARRDGRSGVLRSQLTFTPEGHVHIRALQGAPYSAVFHDRLKLSSGGRRIKIEQKFQLLEPGVPPVKHFSIWQRTE